MQSLCRKRRFRAVDKTCSRAEGGWRTAASESSSPPPILNFVEPCDLLMAALPDLSDLLVLRFCGGPSR
jgi:hypothetical protein